MNTQLKIWNAEYDWRGSYGAFESKNYVVVAETKEAALELVLAENIHSDVKTVPEFWTIEEIDTTSPAAHYISSSCS